MDLPQKTVLITGSSGVIGTIIINNLSDLFVIKPFDLPEQDALNQDTLTHHMADCDVVIHLAWDTKIENYKSEKINPLNNLMTLNVYEAALETGVTRVIMASSVHADTVLNKNTKHSPLDLPTPDSPYGASKVFMESLGRHYASKGLEVVCIRFMGLNLNNKAPREVSERVRFFSHNDCVSLVRSCIEAPQVPDNYALIFGVSRNGIGTFDTANPFGWEPEEHAEDFV